MLFEGYGPLHLHTDGCEQASSRLTHLLVVFQSPGGGEASSGEKDSGSSAGHQVADGSPVEAAGANKLEIKV